MEVIQILVSARPIAACTLDPSSAKIAKKMGCVFVPGGRSDTNNADVPRGLVCRSPEAPKFFGAVKKCYFPVSALPTAVRQLAGTCLYTRALCTCLCTQNIHKRRVHFQSFDWKWTAFP